MSPRPTERVPGTGPLVRFVGFTVGACLFVGSCIALLYLTLAAARPLVGARAASLLALVVFGGAVAVPVYVLAARGTSEG